jgi:hypothetical protein
MVRTGREPRFEIVRMGSRRFVVSDVPEIGRQLFLFSNRQAADQWSSQAAGFAAEPIAAAAAAECALRADAGITFDPLHAAFVMSRPEIEWGPRRPPEQSGFEDAFQTYLDQGSALSLEAMKRAFRDAVFFILVSNPASSLAETGFTPTTTTVCERELLLQLMDDGTRFLVATPERAAAEATAEDWRSAFVCLAVDGPALAEAAIFAGASLSINMDDQNALILEPADLQREWPRRNLTVDDF